MKRIAALLFVVACGGKSSPPANPEPAPEPTPVAQETPTPVAQETPAPAPTPEPATPAPAAPPAPKEARVELAPTAKFKSKVKGTITFKEVEGGVEVTANVEGLKPNKEHAWHIHEKGDCSAPDATSAGEHWNPSGAKHGAPDGTDRHAGDFGNLKADKQGKATTTFTMKGITVGGDAATSVIGKGFIVHEKKDDLKTQPSGNAGNRLACGVIAAAEQTGAASATSGTR